MAVLHLQFDVDSEVHPELHALLSSIGSSPSQAERLRHLAATGLVWERLRLQAYGRMEVPDLGTEPAAARADSRPVPQLPAAASVRAVPGGDATAPRADLAGFVDLSDTLDLSHLDTPGANDADAGRSGHDVASHDVVRAQDMDRAAQADAAPFQPSGDVPELLPLHEIRSVLQALPVLTEVIGAVELPRIGAVAAMADGAPRGEIHALAPTRKTATRSRLMRMNEKGLFKNE